VRNHIHRILKQVDARSRSEAMETFVHMATRSVHGHLLPVLTNRNGF
jgi:hypothetical protein